MRGTNAWMPWTTPIRFTSSTHFHSSSGALHTGPATATPALLKTACAAPKRSYVRCASDSTSEAFETSQRAWIDSHPGGSRRAVSASPFSSTSAIATCAPSAAHASASSRPIPLAAPVTTTTLPSRFTRVFVPGTNSFAVLGLVELHVEAAGHLEVRDEPVAVVLH